MRDRIYCSKYFPKMCKYYYFVFCVDSSMRQKCEGPPWSSPPFSAMTTGMGLILTDCGMVFLLRVLVRLQFPVSAIENKELNPISMSSCFTAEGRKRCLEQP